MDLVAGSATPSRRGFLLGSAVLGAAASAIPTAAAVASAAEGDASADLVLSGARGLRTGPITGHRFSMVGMTWRGGPSAAGLRIRTRRDGEWSGWRALRPLHDGPDRSVEGVPGLRATEPVWTSHADAIDVRGAASGLPDVTLSLIATDGAQDWEPAAGLVHGEDAAPRPRIVTRAEWGADEEWRNGGPWFNRTIKQVHVHHTVNSNDYLPEDVPALLQGIYRYHTKNLGWSDVGYNFLVDRFGQLWEGRAGGIGRPVQGAHTLGFNRTSTGVAVIGDFETVAPEPKVVRALVRLAAWKLDKHGRQPIQTTGVTSQGSDMYPDGQRVRLPVIDGHRDTNGTACPGQHLYALLPVIRERAQKRVDRYSPKG